VLSNKDLRINDRIKLPQIRLIAADGAQLGIITVDEGLRLAREAGLDLVEVAPQSEPPVCRLLDYGKFKYEQKRQKSEAQKVQQKKHHVAKLKELRLHPKTEKHDVDVRIRQARKFLERGDKVLVNMIFRGRELAHQDLGRKMLDEFAARLADVGKVEQVNRLEDKKLGLLLVQGKGEAKSESKPEPRREPVSTPAASVPQAPLTPPAVS
jgi:translation initiation factor IF-3